MHQLIKQITDEEDKGTIELFQHLKSIKKQGYLTKAQLIKILRWKSPRPLRYYEANTEENIKEITSVAFATKNESLKIHILTALVGVRYPAASAILMFYDKNQYPVLDIRVWQQLYKGKLVKSNSRGQNFTPQQWENYLTVIRQLANDLNLTARQVEKRLFIHDRKTRLGKLYK